MNITLVITGLATVVSLFAAGVHWDWGSQDECGDGLLVHVGFGHAHHSSPGSAGPSPSPDSQDCSDGP